MLRTLGFVRTRDRAVGQVRGWRAAVCGLAFAVSTACHAGPQPTASVREFDPNSPNCRKFELTQPVPGNEGGMFAHDLDGDGRMDFVVTSEGHIGAYSNAGKRLWVKKTDIRLFPYTHHPSAIAGDVDGDGRQEVAYLNASKQVTILNATTGAVKKTLSGMGDPVAMAIANLRGKGDRDIILQYSQTKLRAVKAEDGARLWETDNYQGIEHSPLRQADLDGDGFDEVAGANIIDHDGTTMNKWDLGHIYESADSVAIGDIVPGYPIEVVIAEQRGANSHTDVVNHREILFRALNPWNWEDPDKVAVGDFDPERPGLEIYNRSSGGDGTAKRGKEEPFAEEEAPWVLDAKGKLISKYYVNDRKPEWWTGHGLEEICRIDWDGDARDEIVGKERHKNGAGAIVDPITGDFRVVFRAKALRVYAADVHGDYREEVILLDEDGRVMVFSNPDSNKNAAKPRYWTMQHYKRQKQNWNYYSP